MRALSILIVLITACGSPGNRGATPPPPPPDIQDVWVALAKHLAAFPPMTPKDLRVHGGAPPPRPAGAVAHDRELFEMLVKNSALAAKLDTTNHLHVMMLCLSLLDTSEAVGVRCLEEMARANAPTNQWSQYLLAVGLPGGGPQAELRAVDWACHAKDREIAVIAGQYLARSAIYEPTIAAIVTCLDAPTLDRGQRVALVRALGMIGSPRARPVIDGMLARRDLDDAVQAAAIWSFVELNGRHAAKRLETLTPVGPAAQVERDAGRDFVTGPETSDAAPFGLETRNDAGFYGRFADLRSPVCDWVRANGGRDLVEGRRALDASGKRQLLAALVESAGFGFEMVKGSLFEHVDPSDVDALLRVRRAVHTHDATDAKAFEHAIRIVIKRARMGER